MAKLTTLRFPLADIISPEMEALVEKWVLREAYQLNCNIIRKQVQKQSIPGIRLAMQKRIESYEEGIQQFTEELESAQFFPTEKDLRIMRLMARANVGEKDFGRNNQIIKWPGPSEKSMLGYNNLEHSMRLLKILEYNHLAHPKKEIGYEDTLKEACNAMFDFMRYNFNVNNSSDQAIDKSFIFKDRHLYFKPVFVETLTTVFLSVANSNIASRRLHRDFWNTMCTIMFAMVRPIEETQNQSKIVRYQWRGYYIRVKNSSVIIDANRRQIPSSNIQSAECFIPENPVHLGIEAIVLTENRRCIHQEHPIRDVLVSVRVATPSGEVTRYTMQAGYCEACKEYLVLDTDFNQVKQHGVILCPVIDKRQVLVKPQAQARSYSETESRIHQLGYNVQQEVGYTEKQRQIILANILENTDITVHEIKSNINGNINRHRNQRNYEEAVDKWQKDLEFLSGYHIGDIPEVRVEKIVIGQRGK